MEVDRDDQFESEDTPKSLKGFTGGFVIASSYITFDFFGEYAFWNLEYYSGGSKYEYKETLFSFGLTATYTILAM